MVRVTEGVDCGTREQGGVGLSVVAGKIAEKVFPASVNAVLCRVSRDWTGLGLCFRVRSKGSLG